MCQNDEAVAEYLDCTKTLYKDLVAVAKDPETKEIKSLSIVYRVKTIKGGVNIKPLDHPQSFFYVLVDPQNWHVTLLHNTWTPCW